MIDFLLSDPSSILIPNLELESMPRGRVVLQEGFLAGLTPPLPTDEPGCFLVEEDRFMFDWAFGFGTDTL